MSSKIIVVLALVGIACAMHCGLAERKELIRRTVERELAAATGLDSPHTITSLNVTAYLGTWYQMYTDAFNGFIEPHPYCAQAIYGLNANGTISVNNRDRSGGYSGKVDDVRGYAYQPDPKEYPGRLVVRFPFTPVNGPYWIFHIGPIVNGQYQWAVVSDMDKLSLFILARDPETFQSKYQTSVLAQVKADGFTGFLNSPVAIPQGSQCSF
jgi:lipocalin